MKTAILAALGAHVLVAHGGTLTLDGRAVAQAIRFEPMLGATVDGVPVAAVWADRGGASCYDGEIMLFAAPPGKPVVQGKVEPAGCQAKPRVGLANGEIVVVDPPVASKPADATPAVAKSLGSVTLFDARHGAWQAMTVMPEPQEGQ